MRRDEIGSKSQLELKVQKKGKKRESTRTLVQLREHVGALMEEFDAFCFCVHQQSLFPAPGDTGTVWERLRASGGGTRVWVLLKGPPAWSLSPPSVTQGFPLFL